MYGVKRFNQINESHTKVFMLFSALFLNLSGRENHVNSPSCWSETTLRLWKGLFGNGGEAACKDASKDLHSNRKQGYTSIVSTICLLAVFLIHIKRRYLFLKQFFNLQSYHTCFTARNESTKHYPSNGD